VQGLGRAAVQLLRLEQQLSNGLEDARHMPLVVLSSDTVEGRMNGKMEISGTAMVSAMDSSLNHKHLLQKQLQLPGETLPPRASL